MLLVVHAAATWVMAGMIWTIQSVHYPLFRLVGADGFVAYEAEHTARMGRLLVVPALAEVVTAAALVFSDDVPLGISLGSGALLALVWLTTLGVQVPIHTRLSARVDSTEIDRLVRTNWFRTMAWSVRAVIAAALLV